MGERIRSVKVRKLMAWDKDILVGKAKASCARRKFWVNSVLPVDREILSHCQEGRALWWRTFTWEDRLHNSKYSSLPSSFPPALIAEHDVIWYGIFLWSAAVSCHRCWEGHPLPTSRARLAYSMVAWGEKQNRSWLLSSS